jgi:hypothetical protein
VSPDGCPIEVIERETELLDTGMMRLQDVNFETGKADLLPESNQALDIVGQVLVKWPGLKVEVGGHTDSRGTDVKNQALSEARAQSVLNYLTQKFPTLQPSQYSAKGYGESKPVAPNTSQLNMAKNRRVEFVVLNKDVLKRESQRRRLLQQGEQSAPTTPHRPTRRRSSSQATSGRAPHGARPSCLCGGEQEPWSRAPASAEGRGNDRMR